MDRRMTRRFCQIARRLSGAAKSALAVLCIFGTAAVGSPASAERADAAVPDSSAAVRADTDDYVTFLAGQKETPRPDLPQQIPVRADACTAVLPQGSLSDPGDGREGAAALHGDTVSLTYTVEVPEAGLYEIGTVFRVQRDTGRSGYDFSLTVNGTLPFRQAGSLRLTPVSVPAADRPVVDALGNEFSPGTVADAAYAALPLHDPDGLIDGPLLFLLHVGQNELCLTFDRPEGLVLGGLFVRGESAAPSYRSYRGSETAQGDRYLRLEAEAFARCSDTTVSPVSDQSDPRMSPLDLKVARLNSISGDTWATQGQWIEWDVTPEQTGWYALSFRYRQSSVRGLGCRRRLYLDGQVPFREAEDILFPYAGGWETMTFADGKGQPYALYLEAGRTYALRLEVVLDDLAPVIYRTQTILRELNDLYRRIVMITSTNADEYRDYRLDKEIPGLTDSLKNYRKRLDACYDRLCAIADGNTGDFAVLSTLARQLDSFARKPSTIPYRVLDLQSNLGSVSSLLVQLQQQPLWLDHLTLAQADAAPPAARASLWEKLCHGVKSFAVSFFVDYNGLGSAQSDKTVTLWYGGGRDQAQIIWKMVNDTFTPQTGIGADIKLVSASLVEAFLSGRSPDVAINVARDVPVDLALRGGIRCLSDLPGFAESAQALGSDALTPYTLNGKVYALPDTQSFPMLFYRTDVLEELGIAVPDTWDAFVEAAELLQLDKLQAAVPTESDTAAYYAKLLQSGGEPFSQDLSCVLLDTPTAMKAFRSWTDLFTKTGLPLSYDLFNRFRSGEIPLAIAAYTLYGQLEQAAPEIRGRWGMAMCPGTRKADGSIDRTVTATGTAAVILQNARQPEAAWSFIRWWTGSETQARFSAKAETAMGKIARVAVVGADAIAAQDWPREMLAAVTAQQAAVRELPRVPGQYYLDRDLVNAFRDVVYHGEEPLETVKRNTIRINSEIRRKREEFGLEETG